MNHCLVGLCLFVKDKEALAAKIRDELVDRWPPSQGAVVEGIGAENKVSPVIAQERLKVLIELKFSDFNLVASSGPSILLLLALSRLDLKSGADICEREACVAVGCEVEILPTKWILPARSAQRPSESNFTIVLCLQSLQAFLDKIVEELVQAGGGLLEKGDVACRPTDCA